MIYRKPSYYDQFRCIADKCPESCCIGWQIMIDEDSLNAYAALTTPFGNRLYNSIDFSEGCFLQYDKRCAFLNEEDLCDIQCELGEDALCETCKRYPRHVEEYDGLREYSLALSCPEAARIILSQTAPAVFLTEETEEEEWDEDFEEFDDLLFDQLLAVRDRLFSIATDRTRSISKRLDALLFYANKLQNALDEDRIFELEQVLEEPITTQPDYTCKDAVSDFSFLYELEFLHENQKETLDLGWNFIKGTTDTTWQEACVTDAFEETACEQLLMFFLYTYFLGAVYDDMIYSKVALSVFSVRQIMILYQSTRSKNDTQATRFEKLVSASYHYAREVEHSDLNLDTLEEKLS